MSTTPQDTGAVPEQGIPAPRPIYCYQLAHYEYWKRAVSKEGAVARDDRIVLIDREAQSVPVSGITRLYIAKKYSDADLASIREILSIGAVPDGWKDYFWERPQHSKT